MEHTNEKLPESEPKTEDKFATKDHTPQGVALPKSSIMPHSTRKRSLMLHKYLNKESLKDDFLLSIQKSDLVNDDEDTSLLPHTY